MCGIVGLVARGEAPVPRVEQLRAMCDAIVHRGPDDEGLAVEDRVGLGMRRLSIIDLSGGHQPIYNEDLRVRTVFNGEIYNFRELRSELESAGHVFRTHSDTEVLVHGYEQWGVDLPRRLNGMFAFAVHDMERKRLLLARDHLGIKPFYYAESRGSLIFGSEIKCLLASGLVDRRLDETALSEFMTWEYVPAPHTLFDGVFKLQPGHLIEVDLRDPAPLRPRRYWNLADVRPDDSLTAADWEDAVDAKLGEAVRAQLVSDVPLGAFLSGGVDSSLITAHMGRAQTFSIGFEEESYNELDWARRVAEHLGLDHRDEIINPDVVELFDHLMTFMDDPIGDFSIFPTYLVSKLARSELKVALSGDGGDEIFGGYDSYVAQDRAGLYERMPRFLRRGAIEPLARALPPQEVKKGLVNKVKRFVEGTELPHDLGHARWRLFLADEARRKLFQGDTREGFSRHPYDHVRTAFAGSRGFGPVTAGLYADVQTYLPDNILVKADRMSMATSLEVRVPFLDWELVELAFKLPDREKVSGGESKRLLKRVAAKHVPRECVYRPKEGFSIPIKNWLSGKFRPLMEELLDEKQLGEQGLFEPGEVRRLKQEHLSNRANHSHLLWSMMIFQAWRRRWLEG